MRLGMGWACVLALLTAGLTAGPARAEMKLVVVHTASSMATAGFVAAEKGFFAAHGLDVTFTPIAVNSQIPAAVVSGSADIAFLNTSSLILANDNGIDLVAIAGTGTVMPGDTNEAVVARAGSGIAKPADFVGRRVGVPGIAVITDVMFRNWLRHNQVDPARVNFIEVANPRMMDALRGGAVDALVANDPQLYRLIRSGVGVEAGHFLQALPGEIPIIVYAVTRDFARAHPDANAASRAANREGVAYVVAHPEEARAIMARRLNLAPDVVADMGMPRFRPDISLPEVRAVVQMLREQGRLQHKDLDAASLVLP